MGRSAQCAHYNLSVAWEGGAATYLFQAFQAGMNFSLARPIVERWAYCVLPNDPDSLLVGLYSLACWCDRFGI